MIESREQRKKKTLLHRRKVGIVVSLLLAVLLIASSIGIYNFFTTVFYFTDVDGVSEYEIRKVDGSFAMYDKDGKILETTKFPGYSTVYYVTAIGTIIDLDAETGEYTVKAIPDLYYESDGETMSYELLTVFKGIENNEVRSVEINNHNGSYTLFRYNFEELKPDDNSGFVLKHSPLSTLDDQLLSYIIYYTAHPLVKSRIEDPIMDENGEFSEYGLVEETRIDKDGNTYEYKPCSYTVTTTEGIKHTIVIGDRLIDGSGYYVQYINNEGVKRPAVYVFLPTDMSQTSEQMKGNIHTTILGKDTDLVVPRIVYPMTANDYFEVENFTINHRVNGELQEIVGFDYIDLSEREDSVAQNEPYKFIETSFTGYPANQTSIDSALQSLMDPKIVGVVALSPSKETKVKYNLMTKTEQEDGTFKYSYSSKFVVEFEKEITNGQGEKQPVKQTLYVSEANEDGNYYVFTELRFMDAVDDSPIKGISLDSICEVSPESMGFVEWDVYEWVYPTFLQANILYTEKIELISPEYNASFSISHSAVNDLKIMTVTAESSAGDLFTTFGHLQFDDIDGNNWIITPERIYVTTAAGAQGKPESLHFEYNEIGEQVHVIDGSAVTKNGDRVYVTKDKITIQYKNGTTEEFLRYHNTIFKKFFLTVTNTGIVDSYSITAEEEAALLADPSKLLLTVKLYDTEGGVKECNFYQLTARKSYLTIGSEEKVGGFYVQSSRVQKIINDAKKFLAGIDVDYDSHK